MQSQTLLQNGFNKLASSFKTIESKVFLTPLLYGQKEVTSERLQIDWLID